MKALVVDDSRAMRAILRKMLRELGFDVEEACHGRDAMDHLAGGGHPDVALVDWNMPEMNGYDFVCAVRAQHHWDGLRLMMVTTETEMAQVARALEAGANEYIMKPFTRESIRDKLELLGLPT